MYHNVYVNGKKYRIRNPLLFIYFKLDLPDKRVVWRDEKGDWYIRFDTSIKVPETLSSGTGGYKKEW
jgi:hypothetical protein